LIKEPPSLILYHRPCAEHFPCILTVLLRWVLYSIYRVKAFQLNQREHMAHPSKQKA